MKKFLSAILIASVLLGLTACSGWGQDEFLFVTPHAEQPVSSESTEEEVPLTVTNRSELRGAVLSFIRDWTERGTFLVSGYSGDITADLAETIRYATEEDPIGAYAVDYADAELSGNGESGVISLNIVFRRSAAEINSIVTVNGIGGAYAKIQQALTDYTTALTLRIRNYEEADFTAYIRDFCLENPDQMPALPELSAQVYPNEGETRILELHMVYPKTRDELRVMQAEVNTILASAHSFIHSGSTDAERVTRLYRFLAGRFVYTVDTEEPVMPAYRLLCDGAAHSLSFATVFRYECSSEGMDCRLVSGFKDGVSHYWNLIRLGREYYYVDLMRDMLSGANSPELLTAAQLIEEGYVWEAGDYPATPEETDESGNPVENTEATEPSTEPTQPPIVIPTLPPTIVPTEPTSEPTEPTSEPTEPPTESSSSESATTEPPTESTAESGTNARQAIQSGAGKK